MSINPKSSSLLQPPAIGPLGPAVWMGGGITGGLASAP
jgi:hypothetical protein